MYTIRSITIALIMLCMPVMGSAGVQSQQVTKAKMIRELEIIKNTFEVKYAPAEWKKSYSGWDLDTKIAEAQAKVVAKDKISLKDFRRIVKDFFNSTSDYHVGVFFHSTAAAFLPFNVQSAQGKYFVSWVDSSQLPHMAVGDEILTFNGVPIGEVIADLVKKESGNVNCKTDQALAEIGLTARIGAMGHEIPSSPSLVVITAKNQQKKAVQNHFVKWDISPEKISDGPFMATQRSLALPSMPVMKKQKDSFFDKQMSPAFYEPMNLAFAEHKKRYDKNPEDRQEPLGYRTSQLPALGKILWQSSEENPFHAYLFKMPNNKTIGFIRIPSYMPMDEATPKAFSDIINLFQTRTDALVIDQLNNPGGSVIYLYALASMLSPSPLTVPSQRITITQEDVLSAITTLQMLENPEIKEVDLAEEELQGYPITQEFMTCLNDYFQLIISQWNAGNVFTDSNYLYGIHTLTPHPWGYYSKPILMLVNQLDFSGGDFLPAILQDNKRATIMGTKTAGAGGYVLSHTHPNQFGIAGYSVTGSLAERMNKAPIENLGVTPDISYELTTRDLEMGYVDYKTAIQKAIDKLLQK